MNAIPTLAPPVRKTVLVIHVLASAAWIGIDVLVGVLVIAGWVSDDPATRSLAYRTLGTFVAGPMLAAALACLASGVVLGLGTRWGLIRYWWVAVKLVLNLGMCVLVLFVLTPSLGPVRQFGEALAVDAKAGGDVSQLFFPPAVSLTLLTFATILSVFKPWGRMRGGRAAPRVTAIVRHRPVAGPLQRGFLMTEPVETRGDERHEMLAVDTNNDGRADVLAIDTDGNGKADLFQLDSDGDGKIDVTMVDRDEDSVMDTTVDGDGGR
jgi:hypothetical protein